MSIDDPRCLFYKIDIVFKFKKAPSYFKSHSRNVDPNPRAITIIPISYKTLVSAMFERRLYLVF